MKTLAFALDLKDDPAIIRRYEAYHRAVWPELLKGMAEVGVLSQRIFRTGNRLFMIIEADESFDWRRDFAAYMAATPRAKEWDDLMRGFQQKAPGAGPDDWWAPMREVYDLNEQLSRLGSD